jgi:hypothetical protein
VKAVLNVLSRVRSAFRSGWADPVTGYGGLYAGWFELRASRVIGAVDSAIRSSRPPTSVVVLKNGEPIGWTETLEPCNKGWRFEIDVGFDFTRDDVLKERLRIVALDRVGGESVLKISGATQLRYIRSA